MKMINKNKIRIVDPYSTNNFHDVFNFSLIKICENICSDIEVIMGRGGIDTILNFSKNHKIFFPNWVVFKKFKTIEGYSKLKSFLRTLRGFHISIKEYLKAKKNNMIIYGYTNQMSFPFLIFLNIFFSKKVIFCMHGELELFYKKVPIYKISNLYKSLLKLGFRLLKNRNNSYLLVLSKTIKKNLTEIFPDIEENVIFINHPYVYNDKFKKKDCVKYCSRELIIGTIGTLNEDKGLNDIIKLQELFTREIHDKLIQFRVIGRISKENQNKMDNVIFINGENPLSNEEYNKEIEKLDFILFCYPKKSYQLTASGAILDAIAHNIPIISYHNSYFDEIFQDDEPGIFVDNLDELFGAIYDLINKEGTILYNMSNSRVRISLENNTALFKEQLKKRNIVFD